MVVVEPQRCPHFRERAEFETVGTLEMVSLFSECYAQVSVPKMCPF